MGSSTRARFSNDPIYKMSYDQLQKHIQQVVQRTGKLRPAGAVMAECKTSLRRFLDDDWPFGGDTRQQAEALLLPVDQTDDPMIALRGSMAKATDICTLLDTLSWGAFWP